MIRLAPKWNHGLRGHLGRISDSNLVQELEQGYVSTEGVWYEVCKEIWGSNWNTDLTLFLKDVLVKFVGLVSC